MSTTTITVAGMTCSGCASSVRAELKALPGVVGVDIHLSDGTVSIDSTEPLDDAAVKAAVEEAGYQLAN
ncbi:cation-transporting ATPase [Mycolicibacterium duvalii]|uniref:Heavy metal transport/detoxification protein n=1 Tax=Mycolicibacterium duvalii TaxID=39688 RepID=A0A7I7JUA9_9MYCO|nr:heavy metal-associated domain-containing protein [Mycolicibacterium duvalii]MCV7369221.1 heavy-metal-associated domain-containing protein [Mycolicibacterium duvalii]PEG37710.1 cation-transporting ATPase [Mycolicibacterium duvalii]BBX15405.1 heavy metal transport/detoxification protein [Mycolicibacterium duvalii]